MKNYIFFKQGAFRNFFSCFILLSSFSVVSQTINFTIDTAIDNGVSITETILNGGDTYILTIFHSGNEELDDLGGGDLVFYLSAIDPLTPYTLSITKNGNPTNFTLMGIGYDTLGSGTISVLNQDDNEISAPTLYATGSGIITITNTGNAANITAFKILPTENGDLNNFGFHNISVDILDTLSIIENNLEDNLLIYPNPSNGLITFKNNGVIFKNASITDINGRTVERFDLDKMESNTVLDMRSKLSPGIYFMSIVSRQGAITKKLIIQ